jgi:hypothetical protein
MDRSKKMKPCQIQFADKKVQESYKETKERPLKDQLERALCDIEKNPFCGIQIPKKLIPKEYIQKYKVKNLWKYNLPGAWRLTYSIEGSETVIIAIILDWVDHKTYERKFKY